MPHLSKELGIEISIKRDDLTGGVLAGNKIRKLEYLLAEAKRKGATHVITCGGVQSNHCRATAWAARKLGMQPVLILRTPNGNYSELPRSKGNVLLDLLVDADIRLCDPDSYRKREAIFDDIEKELRSKGHKPFSVPEGGSNSLGSLGYVNAAFEIEE